MAEYDHHDGVLMRRRWAPPRRSLSRPHGIAVQRWARCGALEAALEYSLWVRGKNGRLQHRSDMPADRFFDHDEYRRR
ncbi:hypothetical protein [Actinacidiphila sp. bgisy167]|uniref:hypothetical protein n=1 Tax=Actinacidiphila sp. bgisy167 TaxID=3413797 RepID=UPI003D732376